MQSKWRGKARKIFREWRSNLIVWLIQWIGGSAVISAIGNGLWREVHRAPLDWYFIGAVFLFGLILVIVGVWLQQKANDVPAAVVAEKEKLPASPEMRDPTYKALMAMVDEDAEKIGKLIRREHTSVEFYYDLRSDPYVDVVIRLTNYSLFELVTFGEIEGYTTYAGDQQALAPQVVDTAGPPPLLSLKRGQPGTLRIRQFISANVADLMWTQRSRKIPFDLRRVGIKFKMLLVGLPARDFMVYGPVVTIDEAKRL